MPALREPPSALAWSEAVANGQTLARPVVALWRPRSVYAALGLSQSPEKELALDENGCLAVPLVRRQSGGGAVLLYPGVLCWEAFASVADIDAAHGKNAGIRPAYDFLAAPVVASLAAFGVAAFRAGISDVSASRGGAAVRKIAGTAQYRRRDNVLVHGALLVHADIDEMARHLAFPSSQPDYRDGRTHREFCVNLAELTGRVGEPGDSLMAEVSAAVVAAAEDAGWSVAEIPETLTGEAALLEREKYRDRDWNWSRKRPAR